MGNFDSIIFDLGGVLIDIDVDRALSELASLTGKPGHQFDWTPHLQGFFHQFEIGNIGEDQFRGELRQALGLNLGDKALDHCWNELLRDLPIHRLQYLKTLRKKYRMVLLSNTNPIHIRTVYARLEGLTGIANFSPYFDEVYYSYQLHLAKPDPRIYQEVLDGSNFVPKRTLLVDDNHDNIQAASDFGLQVFQVDQPDSWIAYFKQGED